MADLVVRNGTIVDGTGAPAFVGDVAIVDGRVVAVGSDVDGAVPAGTEEIDATGLLVTPGWVDIHTHYDGQATWDDVLAPTACSSLRAGSTSTRTTTARSRGIQS